MAKPPTRLASALLGLLHQGPQSGYDLRKIFEATALGNYSSSPGAIYPALRRLEEQGLVRGEVDDSTALRPRKLFSPTAAGRAALREWLTGTISSDDVARRLDDLMLRFAFHAVLDDPGATRRFLLELAEKLDAYVGGLEAQFELFPPEMPIHPRLALQAGIEQYRATARWARDALEELERAS